MFNNISKNNKISKAEALRLSINELIDENLHPIFWSPFMLIGDSK